MTHFPSGQRCFTVLVVLVLIYHNSMPFPKMTMESATMEYHMPSFVHRWKVIWVTKGLSFGKAEDQSVQ